MFTVAHRFLGSGAAWAVPQAQTIAATASAITWRNLVPCRNISVQSAHESAKSCVMNPLFTRIEHVSESVVEPLRPLITKDSPVGESFEALYRSTFPRVYGYVAS